MSYGIPTGCSKHPVLGSSSCNRGSEAMNAQPVQGLHTPLGKEVLELHAGDYIGLSGIVYTARDEAHIRMKAEGHPLQPAGCGNLSLRSGSAGQKNHSRLPDNVCQDERTVRYLPGLWSQGPDRERRHGAKGATTLKTVEYTLHSPGAVRHWNLPYCI